MFDNVARQLVDGDTGAEARWRILVVDDEGSIREVLVHYLEAAGFAAMEAPDGATALRAAASFPPDLVILDVMLPGIDGTDRGTGRAP